MSFILSIGKPVWRPIFDLQEGQYRFVFAWFSFIVVTFDVDAQLANLIACDSEAK